LPARKRVLVLLQALPVFDLALELLAPDVVLDGRFVQPRRGDVVALGPEVPASVVAFGIRVLAEDHEARLPFQVPHERRRARLRRYPHQHADVVRHRVGPDDLDALALAEPPDALPDVGPQFCIYRFSAIFRSEHDAVLTVPPRMRQTTRAVILDGHEKILLPGERQPSNRHSTKEDFSFPSPLPLFRVSPA